jgi:hypothetical protein
MNKFIIFKLKDITASGASVSDDGTGIEVISVPVSSIAYMTASLGEVSIFFNDVSSYEQSNLSTGESFQKSYVTVSCRQGDEVAFIERIADFSSSTKARTYLTFDATQSILPDQIGNNIKAFIKDNPVNRVTREPSLITDNGFTASTSYVVNDIDFAAAANMPILDLDCRDATYSASVLATWPNGGTGGATYDVDVGSSVGTIYEYTGGADSGFNVNAVGMYLNSYTVLSSTVKVASEYTVYAVFTSGLDGVEGTLNTLYGSSSGETVGLSATSENTSKQPITKHKFGVRHEDRVGLPAQADSPIYYEDELPTVIVIRRDSNYNITAYDYRGVVVASIPASVTEVDSSISSVVTFNGDTGGSLFIDQVGSSGGDTSGSFKGGLGRFGVIERDIGSVAAQKLARDLYKLYNL